MRKLAALALFPLFLAAARFLPLNRLPSTCVFYHVTGRPCPTCGITRSIIALTHLDFGSAIAFHPLAVAFVGMFGVLWGAAVYEAITGRSTVVVSWARCHALKLTLSALGLLLIFSAFRLALQ